MSNTNEVAPISNPYKNPPSIGVKKTRNNPSIFISSIVVDDSMSSTSDVDDTDCITDLDKGWVEHFLVVDNVIVSNCVVLCCVVFWVSYLLVYDNNCFDKEIIEMVILL
jgi:hypothetical protein